MPASRPCPTASSSASISCMASSRRSKASTGTSRPRWASATTAMSSTCRPSPAGRNAAGRSTATRLRSAARTRPASSKWTLPGPMTICDTIADGHYGRRADMAMAFRRNPQRGGAGAGGCRRRRDPVRRAGLQRLHGRREGVGHRRAGARRARPEMRDRRPHLLRLRHRGQHQVEGDAGRRMAAVRGDFSGDQRIVDQPSVARMRQFPRADLADRRCCRTRMLLVGAIDVASNTVETPEQVAATIDAGAEACRRRAHPALHQLRHGAAAARGCRRQAQGARRGRGAGETRHAGPHVAESG